MFPVCNNYENKPALSILADQYPKAVIYRLS